MSVDPLAESFPHNAVYAYAENRPIDGIDLEGLEFFSIHGVLSSPEGFKNKPRNKEMPKFIAFLRENVSNSKGYDESFRWDTKRTRRNGKKGFGKSNDLFFSQKDLTKATKKLVKHVLKHRDENDEITLAGFSGGALLATATAPMIYEQTGIKVNVIAINPPAMKDPNSKFSPSGKEGINDMLIMQTDGDPIPEAMIGARGDYTEADQLDPEYQRVRVKSDGKFIGKHMVKNINMESVKAANMEKLKPVEN